MYLLHVGNYLHGIYVVLDILSDLEIKDVGYVANTAPLYIQDSSTLGFLYLGVGVAGTHPPHPGKTTVVLIIRDTKQQS